MRLFLRPPRHHRLIFVSFGLLDIANDIIYILDRNSEGLNNGLLCEFVSEGGESGVVVAGERAVR